MRLFAAVSLSDDIKESLRQFQSELQTFLKNPKNAKWVPPANFHLTLKFFGEVEESKLDSLQNALVLSSEGVKPFSINIAGAGCFPDLARPRVLWAGVESGLLELKTLSAAVEARTVQAGFPPLDKPFSAHATLARFSGALPPSFAQFPRTLGSSVFGRMEAGSMSLYQSVPGPSGPVYKILKEFPFHAG